ncbi:Flp pilus assembly complex ATPase component TadA [Candidatus Micrarchaeota archaeon]|nr:Flp pilus assembly complex ATPase component TadA [Candidatus Micrarchaeota archaeon]
MCILSMEGNRAVMDCLRCGLGLGSGKCINSHLKALAGSDRLPITCRYEEEVVVELDEERTKILSEYIKVVQEIDRIAVDPKIYGMKEDDNYYNRRELLKQVLEEVYMGPQMAVRTLESYEEPYPTRSMFYEGYALFKETVKKITEMLKNTELYRLCEEHGDLQHAFLHVLNMSGFELISSLQLPLPKGAKLKHKYDLTKTLTVEIYEIPHKEELLYRQKNRVIENLPENLLNLLKQIIKKNMRKSFSGTDIRTIYQEVERNIRGQILDEAMLQNITVSNEQANEMAREAASWVIGLGAPIENIALDKNVSDIYIDSQNAPIYIEHAEYGICHTPWRYNKEMMERMFTNIMIQSGETRKFDERNPVVDVFVPRLNMRCHLQRPPATFNDLQAALRIMRTEPFTYPLYLKYKSMSPFFAGYDDLMVSLGSSEAVLGLKGSGKTSLVGAKIAAIGTSRRILPIQDIEEIPVKAYRKRGFHIGSVRVQSSEKEREGSNELDLVTMANVSLRLGDACVIINEIRSRVAIQGVINLLNTQPGVFLLYNFHAESLRDVQDRLELVFGIPSAAMFSTDRYTVLYKVRFGRKGKVYRVIGKQYETDMDGHKFVEVFTFKRGRSIEDSQYVCHFLANPEASAQSLEGVDLVKLFKNLQFVFIPPVLKKRAEQIGLTPKQCIMQAFFKGKVYDDIYRKSIELNDPYLLELDFVLKCNTEANLLLKQMEDENGNVDYGKLIPIWNERFAQLVEEDRRARLGTTK